MRSRLDLGQQCDRAMLHEHLRRAMSDARRDMNMCVMLCERKVGQVVAAGADHVVLEVMVVVVIIINT